MLGLVQSRVQVGKKISVVDMTNVVPLNELVDGIHPNNDGYLKMAQSWYNSMNAVAGKLQS